MEDIVTPSIIQQAQMSSGWKRILPTGNAKAPAVSMDSESTLKRSGIQNHTARIERGGFEDFTLDQRLGGNDTKVIIAAYPVVGPMHFRSAHGFVMGFTNPNEPLVVQKTPVFTEVYWRSVGSQYDLYRVRKYYKVLRALRCGNDFKATAMVEWSVQVPVRTREVVKTETRVLKSEPEIRIVREPSGKCKVIQTCPPNVIAPWNGTYASRGVSSQVSEIVGYYMTSTSRSRSSQKQEECEGDKPTLPPGGTVPPPGGTTPPVIPPVTTPPNNPEHGFGPPGTGVGKGEPGASIDGPPVLPPGTGQVDANLLQ